ncbi:MAG: MBL fold metallo-hydrolase [Gammaproteobacteria bacterium]|nr:MBL fold metallo-hydrolase [Gammaproteobacteria bacterium]
MKTQDLGEVSICSIIERDGPWRKPQAMFPRADRERTLAHLSRLPPYVYDAASDLLVITYQTFVVRTAHHTILIDTCTGEDKGHPPPMDFPKQPWLDAFKAQGLSFEDIDFVFCTHLHIDHCGWNTRLHNGRWVPTFPRAKYVFSRREYEYWEAQTRLGANPPGNVWTDSCLPVVEAGQALLVDDDHALDDNLWLTPTPGHSPGHICVNVRGAGRRAVFTGDLMHHVLQCLEPDWSSCFCADPAQSALSRRRLLGEVADTDTLVLPTHFPGPTAGRVVSRSDGWWYEFVD